jgi:hypothetical protein
VYRVSPASTSGKPQCLALRLMVDPKHRELSDAGDEPLAMPHVAEATA